MKRAYKFGVQYHKMLHAEPDERIGYWRTAIQPFLLVQFGAGAHFNLTALIIRLRGTAGPSGNGR